jgi:predicted DsbA family dithiol-disulfide isomerase
VDVQALGWSDYCCPWAYVGQHRTSVLESLGVSVTTLPYELHPEWGPDGIAVSTGGRFGDVLRHLTAEAESAGLRLVAPTRLPSTRLALLTMEVVRIEQPNAWMPAHRQLFAAVWEHGLNLNDETVLADMLTAVGITGAAALIDAARGHASQERVDAAREQAHDVGATGTPAWWVDGRLLIPGLQDPDQLARWVERLRARPRDPNDQHN